MVQKPYNPRKRNSDTPQSDWSGVARYSGLAFQMGVVIALFAWGGYELDRWMEMSFPLFLSVGLLLGIALGMYSVIKNFIGKR